MPDPIFGVLYQSWPRPDGSFHLEYLSDGAESLLEMTADEVARALVEQTVPLYGVDATAFYRSLADSAQHAAPWSTEFGFVAPKSGMIRWFRAQDFPCTDTEGNPYFSGVLIDISAMKQAEEESRRAYDRLSTLLAHMPLAVVEWNADTSIRRWSGAAETMFGWTSAEVVGRSLFEFAFVHEGDTALVAQIAGELLKQAVPGNVARNRNYHKSGRVLPCQWHNSARLDAGGRVESILSLAQDLTEQHAVEQELTLSDERLRTSLRLSGMLSWDFDYSTGRATYSQDVREFFDQPDLAPDADLDYGVAHEDDRPRCRAGVAAAVAEQRDFRIEYRGRLPKPDGTDRWFASRGAFIATGDGVARRCVGVTVDITEKKLADQRQAALDRELREARHLESLGVLAGGIAHDFNNLLTIILGHAGVMKYLAPADEPLLKNIREIENAGRRAAELCNQIAGYAGVGRLLAADLDPDALLAEAEAAARVAIPSGAGVTWRLQPDPGRIRGEGRQLKQALANVLSNAFEAVASKIGGEVAIVSERLAITGSPDGFVPSVRAGEYLLIRIADNGTGMSPEVQARALEAFFSTKFAGRGLGLPAAAGIVRSHRGGIRVQSELGIGTTVELLFPIQVESEPRGRDPVFDAAPETPGAILVVDDDADIRELICSVLEDEGHTVVAAANGIDAEAIFNRDPAAFRLAVVDLIMPGLAGGELIRRFRERVAGFPVLVVSGYSDRELPKELLRTGPTTVLPKPFRLEQLTGCIRAMSSALGRAAKAADQFVGDGPRE